jgi:predicted ATPase
VAAISPSSNDQLVRKSPSGPDPWRLFSALTHCFTELAVKQPVLVVLDNLNLADHASLYLLDYLVTALKGVPVCFLGMLCPEALGAHSPLVDLIGKLELAGRAQCLELGPLSRSDTVRLVALSLDGVDRSRGRQIGRELVHIRPSRYLPTTWRIARDQEDLA